MKKERKKERLALLLPQTSLRWSYKETPKKYHDFTVWTDCDCKQLSHCFNWSMSFAKAESFINELVLWDGWTGLRRNSPGRCYYTTEVTNRDFVQAVAVQAGLTTSVTMSNRSFRDWTEVDGRDKNTTEAKKCYNVEFLNRSCRGTQTMIKEKVSYQDNVFCITVPTSYFVARTTDGHVFITGNCHELYDFDYGAKTATFVRTIGLCKTCHTGVIHSGRAITCYKNHVPLWTKDVMLDAAEHGMRLVYEWNQAHPDQEKLRMFATIKEWLNEPSLVRELEELIEKYQISFYDVPPTDTPADWGKWKLIFEDTEYYSPYKSIEEWEYAMKLESERQAENNRQLFDGDEFEELRKNLGSR